MTTKDIPNNKDGILQFKKFWSNQQIIELKVFDPSKNIFVFTKNISNSDKFRINKLEGHDYLNIEYFEEEEIRYYEISVSGIKHSLGLSQTVQSKVGDSDDDGSEWEEMIEKKFPIYKQVHYIGYSSLKDLFILTAVTEDVYFSGDPNGTDVLTNNGHLLFTVKNGILPIKAYDSGLLFGINTDDEEFIIDLKGNIVAKFPDDIEMDDGYINLPKEVSSGIFEYNYGNLYLNAYTGEEFYYFTKDYAIRPHLGRKDEEICDVIERATNKILLNNVRVTNFDDMTESWYLLRATKLDKQRGEIEEHYLLGDGHLMRLEESEEILFPLNSENGNNYFISENRIISYILKGGAVQPEFMKKIIIRDFNGNIIQSIQDPDILIKQPYKFGKALGFKVPVFSKHRFFCLMYLDLQGMEHSIPFYVEYISEAYDVDCRFVSADTILIKKGKSGGILIDIGGNVLYDCGEGSVEFLTDNYFKYYNDGHFGVRDSRGNEILPSEYNDITILS